MTRGRARPARLDDDDGAEGPLRRCIVSGEVQSPERMVRFVEGPDHAIVPDVAHKLARPRVLGDVKPRRDRAGARARVVFEGRQVVGHVSAPILAIKSSACWCKRCIDHLGLARRAGQIVIGFAQVEQAFRARDGRIAALVEARESGPADRGKLVTYAQRQGAIPVIGCLSEARNRLGIRPGKCGTCCANGRRARHSVCDRGRAAWRFPRFVSA